MELRIQHTWPLVGVQTTPARQSIEQPQANLEITSTPAQLLGGGEPFHVEIDQYPCRAEYGLKNDADLSRDFALQGQQAVLEGIGRRATEGSQLGAIENKGNPIAQIAQAKAIPPPADFVLEMLPQTRPEINFVGGKKLEIEPGGVDIQVRAEKPIIDYQPGKVELFMQQRPEFSFEFVGNNLDIMS